MSLNGAENGERIHQMSLGSWQDNFPDGKEIIKVRGLQGKKCILTGFLVLLWSGLEKTDHRVEKRRERHTHTWEIALFQNRRIYFWDCIGEKNETWNSFLVGRQKRKQWREFHPQLLEVLSQDQDLGHDCDQQVYVMNQRCPRRGKT